VQAEKEKGPEGRGEQGKETEGIDVGGMASRVSNEDQGTVEMQIT